jgi:hypothetical protein
MDLKEHVLHEIDTLNQNELNQLVQYISYLKKKSIFNNPDLIIEKKVLNDYTDFSDEDRMVAEEGIGDYNRNLLQEDLL